jgi:asparagine synthetase B (glutamine-hydrolysing)
MCGLFGAIGQKIVPYEIKIIEKMSYLTCFRGIDSTGVFTIHDDPNFKYSSPVILKNTSTPPEFIHSNTFQKHVRTVKEDLKVIAGHSRAATYGSVVASNAHPFRKDHITGMHNGSIPQFANWNGDTTDSEHLFELMAKSGPQSVVDQAKGGAYALVWHDSSDNTLNFLRNPDRPLFFAKAPGDLILWMSEEWMLDTLFKSIGWGKASIEELPVHTHYSVDVDTLELSKNPCKPTTVVQRAAARLTKAIHYCYPYTMHSDEVPWSTSVSFGPVPNMPEQQVRELLDEGCVNCYHICDPSDKFMWIPFPDEPEDSFYFCDDCVNDGHYRAYGILLSDLYEKGTFQ